MGVVRFTDNDQAIDEGSDALYIATFKEPREVSGAIVLQAVASGAILTISAWLTRPDTGAVINSRNGVSILGANGGSVSAGGVLSLLLSGADVALGSDEQSGNRPQVRRRLRLLVTYTRTGGGVGTINHQIDFLIRNLAAVG